MFRAWGRQGGEARKRALSVAERSAQAPGPRDGAAAGRRQGLPVPGAGDDHAGTRPDHSDAARSSPPFGHRAWVVVLLAKRSGPLNLTQRAQPPKDAALVSLAP
jgi:hypothetical protein